MECGQLLASRFEAMAGKHAGRKALVTKGPLPTSLTYRELLTAATRLGESLKEIAPTDSRVIISGSALSAGAFVTAFLAAATNGYKMLLCGPPNREGSGLDLAKRFGARLAIFASPDAISSAQGSVSRYRLKSPHAHGLDVDVVDLGSTVDGQPEANLYSGAVCFLTSGTTGVPKLVCHSQEGLVASVDMVQSAFNSTLGLSRKQLAYGTRLFARRPRAVVNAATGRRVWMTSFDLWRISGNTLLLQALLTGGTFVVPASARSAELVAALQEEKVTVIALSPIGCEFLVRYIEKRKTKLPHLLVVGLGADFVPSKLISRTRSAIGCSVVSGYGATELSGGISTTDPLVNDVLPDGCVGQPLPGASIQIVDERDVRLGPRQTGRVKVSLPRERFGFMSGDEELAKTSEEEWQLTGDRGWLDEDGRLYIVGRADDVVVKGGANIDPTSIEQQLIRHPAVSEVAVVGIPHRGVTQVIAVVVPRNSGKDINQAWSELGDWAVDELGRLYSPDQVAVVTDLPRSADGGLRRSEIRNRLERGFLDRNSGPTRDAWLLSLHRISVQAIQPPTESEF